METNFAKMTKAELKSWMKTASKSEIKSLLVWENEQSAIQQDAMKAKKASKVAKMSFEERIAAAVAAKESKRQSKANERNAFEAKRANMIDNPSSIEAIQDLLFYLTVEFPANAQARDDKQAAYTMLDEFCKLNLFDDFAKAVANTILKMQRCSSKQLYCLAKSLQGKVAKTDYTIADETSKEMYTILSN
ncbi:MAG: hypothetical protein KGZ71_09815 [Desulfobulbaceae bacterium]|nr:hypothetical protein [Desulfobulbaceae bacterium]